MNSIEAIIPIIVMIVIGYALKRAQVLNADDTIALNKIVVNIALPSLIFLAIYSTDLSIIPRIAPIPFICIVVGIVCGLIAYLVAKKYKYPRRLKWSVVSTSAMFNSGFLGYPIVLGVFGADGFVRAIFYDLGSMILFIGFGIFFLSKFGGKYSEILKRALIFPPLWGIVLGLLLNFLNIHIGFLASKTVDYLGSATVPLIMISLGLSLEFKGIKKYINAISVVSIIKLVIAPLIAFAIAFILGMGGLEKPVTVLEAGMPSAMLSLVLAITYDLDINATAACIFSSTILSMITIPIILLLLSGIN